MVAIKNRPITPDTRFSSVKAKERIGTGSKASGLCGLNQRTLLPYFRTKGLKCNVEEFSVLAYPSEDSDDQVVEYTLNEIHYLVAERKQLFKKYQKQKEPQIYIRSGDTKHDLLRKKVLRIHYLLKLDLLNLLEDRCVSGAIDSLSELVPWYLDVDPENEETIEERIQECNQFFFTHF